MTGTIDIPHQKRMDNSSIKFITLIGRSNKVVGNIYHDNIVEIDQNNKKVVQIYQNIVYYFSMEGRNKEIVYSREELINIISKDTGLCNSAIYKRINKMIASGHLIRVGTGQYIFANKKIFDYSITLTVSLNMLDKLKSKLDKNAKFIVYETTLLNMFLNHLIGKPTIIVEVEKELLQSIFWFLKEEGFRNVLLNPSENENYIYNPYDGSGVILKPLVSKSPIDNEHHKITIEKLVVDIVCDKTLNMFYEGAEIPHMVENIIKNYALKFDSVRNYAKRRHSLDRFVDHVPEELKETFNV